ncbi:MAG TPA: carbohydrate ABC transporter permease [Roseiflexaceae bacterium]|jgi:ABC-type glycerol-3-phosphate transport system permease component|nr:carbohydrate ABC transporter permease [Roseiflexaceae bacterium]
MAATSVNQESHAAGHSKLTYTLIYIVLFAGAIASILPFVYMVSTSLKTYGSVINNNFWPWPPFGVEGLQWSNYPEAIRTVGWDDQWQTWLVVRYFANTLIITAVVVAGVLLTSVLAAYAFAQMNLPGKNVLFMLVLATIMIPNDLVLVPKVVMMYNFKWYNTYLALTVPFMANVLGIFLLRQFFLQIPKDLFEAARIDGASHLRYLFQVVIPLSKAAIVTIALLNFIASWDEFKWPLLVTRDASMRVLAVGLQQFTQSEGGTSTQLLMAFATLVILPVIIFYLFTQEYFTQGITTTGIKG